MNRRTYPVPPLPPPLAEALARELAELCGEAGRPRERRLGWTTPYDAQGRVWWVHGRRGSGRALCGVDVSDRALAVVLPRLRVVCRECLAQLGGRRTGA